MSPPGPANLHADRSGWTICPAERAVFAWPPAFNRQGSPDARRDLVPAERAGGAHRLDDYGHRLGPVFAGGLALYLDPFVPANDLAKLSGSLIFLIGLPGLYAFQAAQAGRLGLAGFGLDGRFTIYFDLSYLVIVAGFVRFGIATSRTRVYPRWTGPVIAIGAAAAIAITPLASVPTGPFRLDRIGVLAASSAFARCCWHLLRHPAAASPRTSSVIPSAAAIGSGQHHDGSRKF